MPDFLLDRSDPEYWQHRQALNAALDFVDSPLIVSIKKKTQKRSIQQNKYYWGVVMKYIMEETGMHSALLHILFKEAFIPWVVFEDDFELSTKNLSTQQMWDYIEWVREFSAKFCIVRFRIPTQSRGVKANQATDRNVRA